MSEDALRAKMARMRERIDLLEAMIEDRTREVYLTNEKLRSAGDFLHEIYHAMAGGLLVLDQSGAIETVNRALLVCLDYQEEELLGKPASLVFAEGDFPAVADIEALAAKNEVYRAEKNCRSKGGWKVPVLLSVTLTAKIPGSGEASQKIVCMALDVREQKKLELELRQAQKLESVGRLAAGVAHEINTPIQFVSDSVQFVKESMEAVFPLVDGLCRTDRTALSGPASAAVRQGLERLEQEADWSYVAENTPKALERALDGLDRVANIVRSMKEFAHPDNEQVAPHDLNQALANTLIIAKNEYKYVADAELQPGEIPAVPCNLGALNQAFLNLIVNAAHAIGEVSKEGGTRGKITVRSWREGDEIVISISDTGAGIPDPIKDKIFDQFFTTKPVGKGTGMGLALALSTVRKHGGSLTFESVAGHGTVFFVRLPLGPAAVEPSPLRTEAA